MGSEGTAASTALVGRDAECRRLQDALQAARTGTTAVVVLRGPPGSGKTALLEWAQAQAAEHPDGPGVVGLSRAHLGAAHAAFRRLRAAPWAALAASELRAAGGRVDAGASGPALDRLSPQELQVSMAVARGLSNREVAETLFLSRKTVEFHLTNV